MKKTFVSVIEKRNHDLDSLLKRTDRCHLNGRMMDAGQNVRYTGISRTSGEVLRISAECVPGEWYRGAVRGGFEGKGHSHIIPEGAGCVWSAADDPTCRQGAQS